MQLNCKFIIFVIMKDWSTILKKLRTSIDNEGIDAFHVVEDLVPIEEQTEFFNYFDSLSEKKEQFVRDDEIEILFSPTSSIEQKKRSLTLLSSLPDVPAYRAIETYQSNPLEAELKNWAAVALVSSRIVVSSDLSGKKQVYISSGLGGHDKKLRFYSLFAARNLMVLTSLQKQIIEREFKFQLHKEDVDIEAFDIKDHYFSILMLFPFTKDVRSILRAIISECNQYGNFLDSNFLFTNVKIFSDVEIQQFLDKKAE